MLVQRCLCFVADISTENISNGIVIARIAKHKQLRSKVIQQKLYRP